MASRCSRSCRALSHASRPESPGYCGRAAGRGWAAGEARRTALLGPALLFPCKHGGTRFRGARWRRRHSGGCARMPARPPPPHLRRVELHLEPLDVVGEVVLVVVAALLCTAGKAARACSGAAKLERRNHVGQGQPACACSATQPASRPDLTKPGASPPPITRARGSPPSRPPRPPALSAALSLPSSRPLMVSTQEGGSAASGGAPCSRRQQEGQLGAAAGCRC